MTTINATSSRRARTGLWGGMRRLVAGLSLGFVATGAVAASNSITGMDYTSLSGNRVRIELTLEHPGAEPSSFTVEKPARIALDLADTRTALKEKRLPIGLGVVDDVTAIEGGGRSRVVVKLAQLVPYEIETQGNQVFLTLNGAGAAPATTEKASFGEPKRVRGNEFSIENVDFRRNEDGSGLILIDLSDPGAPVNIRQEGGKLIADFHGATLPERLERRLDVIDFATPVQFIDTRRNGNNVRMVVTPSSAEYDQMAYQAGDVFTLEFKPITPEEKAARSQEPRFKGERLSLNFQDIEVRSVLQLIADFTGLNVVVSDSVSGNITLRLQEVPWDQALDIILRTKGLDHRREGNVLLIAPAAEIATFEREQLEAQQQISQLKPLRSEFIQVNYAKAADIARLLKEGGVRIRGNTNTGDMDVEFGGSTIALLSERGTVTVDDRTNTLIVQDTEDNLDSIRRLVAKLDIPVRQVLIESRIVIATDEFVRELGVRFGYSRSGTIDDMGAVIGGTQPGYADYGGTTGISVGGSGNEGLIVDLPASDPAGAIGMAVGKIGSYLLQLELSAMETEGRGDVVSSPRVITANQKAATIEQGVEVPYSTTSDAGTETEFKKAVLGLTVTPQITPDDRVLLDLQVNKDSIGQNTPDGPAINTQSVTTQVLVDNGETVVLGGIYERTNGNDVKRVPLLGELPLVGHLFRSTLKQDRRSELLVFVTPKILSESLSGDSVR